MKFGILIAPNTPITATTVISSPIEDPLLSRQTLSAFIKLRKVPIIKASNAFIFRPGTGVYFVEMCRNHTTLNAIET
jgi:hypothetical protein